MIRILAIVISIFLFIPVAIASPILYETLSFGGSISISNSAPVIEDENPTNESSDISISLATVSVTIEEPEGGTFDWTIQGSFITNSNANGASNGTKSANVIDTLEYNTEYTWYVNVTDGTYWTNETFIFTTESETPSELKLYETLSFGGSAYVSYTLSKKTYEVLPFGSSLSIDSNNCPSSNDYSIINKTTNVVIIPHL